MEFSDDFFAGVLRVNTLHPSQQFFSYAGTFF